MPVIKSKGNFPYQFSFIEVKPENIILSALKKAEDSEEVILRLFETKGETTDGEIDLFQKPISVKRVNLLEEEEGEIECGDKTISLQVKPFEIVSLKVRF